MAVGKASVPKSPVPGMNTKTTGRHESAKAVKTSGVKIDKEPIKKASVEHIVPDKSGTAPVELHKEAGFMDMLKGFVGTVVKPAAAAAGTVLGGLTAVKGIQYLTGKLDEPKFEASFQQAINNSPTLQLQGYAKLRPYFDILKKGSPTIAMNPLLTANQLEYMVDAEGHMNLDAFNNALNMEGRVISNNNDKNKLINDFGGRAGLEAIKGTFEQVGRYQKNLANQIPPVNPGGVGK